MNQVKFVLIFNRTTIGDILTNTRFVSMVSPSSNFFIIQSGTNRIQDLTHSISSHGVHPEIKFISRIIRKKGNILTSMERNL